MMCNLGIKGLFKEIHVEKGFSINEIHDIQVTMASEAVHIIGTETVDEVKFHFYGISMTDTDRSLKLLRGI